MDTTVVKNATALAVAGRPTLGWVLGVAFVINTILDYLAG
jgi:hypothetical protein